MQDELQMGFVDHHGDSKAGLDHRLNAGEALLWDQSAQYQSNQFKQIGPFSSR